MIDPSHPGKDARGSDAGQRPGPIGTIEPGGEPKGDPLSMLAVDANELARAIWSGQGTDVSRLVTDLLRGRDAA